MEAPIRPAQAFHRSHTQQMDISSALMYSTFEFRDSGIPAKSMEDAGRPRSLRWPATPEHGEPNPKYKAAWLGLRVVLKNYHGMFMNRKMVTASLLDTCGAFIKQEMKRTALDAGHRVYLANSGDLWTLLTDVFEIGTRVLRLQSFPDAPTYDDHGCSFSNFMASNHTTLTKDIERLNDLLSLSRNMLLSTSIAQEAAASAKFDQQVLQVIDACIRVTARGYDGEPANNTETKWATIIAAYKKLTMTALQWLHNFVAYNEQRKLHLFNQLFGDFQVPDPDFGEEHISPEVKIEFGEEHLNLEAKEDFGSRAHKTTRTDYAPPAGMAGRNLADSPDNFDPSKFQEAPALKVMDVIVTSVRGYCQQTMRQVPEYPSEFPEAEYGQFLVSVMKSLKDKHQNGLCGENVPNFAALPAAYFRQIRGEPTPYEVVEVAGPEQAQQDILDAKEKVLSEFLYQMAATERDYDLARLPVPNTSEDGLSGETQAPAVDPQSNEAHSPIDDDDATNSDELDPEDGEDDLDDEEEDDEHEDDGREDDEEEDEDSEDEIGSASRGLLTDIPLVLGPTEIEALPLMIQASIRSVSDPRETSDEVHVMQALRCYRMISESAGKNLLRELLIFIAAWDLQEHDSYFRMMTSIMETILSYGLMPYAFNSFSEEKDVVSPAQSILIKLLTNMFRKRQSDSLNDMRPGRPSALFPAPPDVEATIVRYIFMVFRTHIIPQTCALIYLQGQIRMGKVLPEDFPLNLWDMERVYEGVYQFLEFFAVLTETEAWKALLVREEVVFELITLLRELDISIPKSTEMQTHSNANTEPRLNSLEAETQAQANILHEAKSLGFDPPTPPPAPLAVERPYDPSPPAEPSHDDDQEESQAIRPHEDDAEQEQDLEAQSDTASAMMENNIEPADFEWRNLKKLVVLVLSSLVWRSRTVQDQIREHGGVEMILNCCNADGNNPYIKDHAVMCLRFLVEGSRENQQIVRDLEERRAAARETREAPNPETEVGETQAEIVEALDDLSLD